MTSSEELKIGISKLLLEYIYGMNMDNMQTKILLPLGNHKDGE